MTWCACRVFVWNFYCCFFCPVLVVTWYACRGFLFLCCSFLVNFTNLSWKKIQHNINNINILSRTVLLLAFILFYFFIHVFVCLFVWFLGWGWGGALAFMKKTGVWGSILLTIYVLVYYILFVFCFFIVQELCESWGGRPGLSVLMSLLVSVDVNNYWTVLQHWSQLVPSMSTDIWGH